MMVQLMLLIHNDNDDGGGGGHGGCDHINLIHAAKACLDVLGVLHLLLMLLMMTRNNDGGWAYNW